jgi:Tfp pilus assembly protein PilV
VRWEFLLMMAALGLINLIGRWMAARAEARKRSEATQLQAEAPRVKASRPEAARVVVRPRSVESNERPKRREPVAEASRDVATPKAAPAVKAAAPRKIRWNSRSVRQAFIASEILARPASSRL